MKNTKGLGLCAILTALALSLAYVEQMIPLSVFIPLPGIKLGLANIVTLTALYLLGVRPAFVILIVRCILGATFAGGISGLIFSLAGGISAMLVMAAARSAPIWSVYGVSVLGAAAHNIGQILAAMAVLDSVYMLYYLPYLMCISIFTGLITGILASGVLKALRKSYAAA